MSEQVQQLQTSEHTFLLNRSGVVFWLEQLNHDTEPDSTPDLIQSLLPRDALALARLILANEHVFVKRQEEMDKLYSLLAARVINYMARKAEELAARQAPWSEVAYHALYTILEIVRAEMIPLFNEWNSASFHDGPYSREQQEQILLSYCKTAYFAKYQYPLPIDLEKANAIIEQRLRVELTSLQAIDVDIVDDPEALETRIQRIQADLAALGTSIETDYNPFEKGIDA